MLVEGHGGTVRAKHERSRLGLVTRLETLVPYQTHQEAWLERSKHWLGSQGRAVDGECTKALLVTAAEPRLDSSTASVDSPRQPSTTRQPRQYCQVDSLDSLDSGIDSIDSGTAFRTVKRCQTVKLDSFDSFDSTC